MCSICTQKECTRHSAAVPSAGRALVAHPRAACVANGSSLHPSRARARAPLRHQKHVRQSAGMMTKEALVAKTSKSRLEKQQGVEEEVPRLPETRVESYCQHASLLHRRSASADNPQQSPITITSSGTTATPDGSGPQQRTLLRSVAMCGDDDTKLSARGLTKQSSSRTTGSELSRGETSVKY